MLLLTETLREQAGKPFRQSLMGETPKTALPHQRTASPTHCLPLALASPFGRRLRWLTIRNFDAVCSQVSDRLYQNHRLNWFS